MYRCVFSCPPPSPSEPLKLPVVQWAFAICWYSAPAPITTCGVMSPTQVTEPPPPPLPPVSVDPLVVNTRRWSVSEPGVGDGEGGSAAAAWAAGSATARHSVIARMLKAAPLTHRDQGGVLGYDERGPHAQGLRRVIDHDHGKSSPLLRDVLHEHLGREQLIAQMHHALPFHATRAVDQLLDRLRVGEVN